jgi:LPS-assembly protein
MKRVRGPNARVQTADEFLTADEIDYNEETHFAEAHGNVHYENFETGEKIDCARAEYDTLEKTGKFYVVSGTYEDRIQARPGLLTTKNPFYFSGAWAERLADKRIIIHDGFITDCTLPGPWWTLHGPAFDIIPHKRAKTRNSWFYVKGVPLFFAPYYYKSLEKEPRQSGFLTPNIGNSSLRGQTVGVGYYWAINRSYDLDYRGLYYSKAGLASDAAFRGRLNETTDFGVAISGLAGNASSNIVGGYLITAGGKTNLGNGWSAGGDLRYLSSFLFREQFTQSFDEAISSETHSVGFLTKQWSDYAFNVVTQRNVNFLDPNTNGEIVIRKLPEAQFGARDHEIGKLPLWFSMDSSYGLERRTEPEFQTRAFVQRADLAPRIITSFQWHSIHVAPSFSVRETAYGSSFDATGAVTGNNLLRSSRDAGVDVALPSLARIFDAPAWINRGKNAKVKHVIEPRITYHYVSGINNFADVIRFDDTDILSNTNEVEFSVTNRLLAKDGNGNVSDVLSWQLAYKRYFDPTFGGAVVAGQRNVVASALDLTGYTFLDGPRHQSPVVSVFKMDTKIGLEWRADYDPVQHGIVNNGITLNTKVTPLVTVSAGQYFLKTDPVLAPAANQFRGAITYGGDNRRGWNYGLSAFYDYRIATLQFVESQVTYNTDCCGLSVQYRRFDFGTGVGARHEDQFRVAFAISNIGTFGTLKRQERIF